MNLRIKPLSEDIYSMYNNHSHFHQGDAGLDLFITKDQVIYLVQLLGFILVYLVRIWTQNHIYLWPDQASQKHR